MNRRRVVKVDKKGIARLRGIQEDLREFGESGMCPMWEEITASTDDSCIICKNLFPKVILDIEGVSLRCPCLLYKSKYIIHRLDEIIKYSEEETTK